ncbi:MAG TPA: ABC transporter permease [Terriglobales bacterium]|nr:ABC transporter permease [Terriglobales bacterium]
MTGVLQDVRYALRQLRKSPGFTAVTVVTLALGIGANTAIFSLINAVMLRTLPVRDPQRLVLLRWSALHDPHTHQSYNWAGCPNNSPAVTIGSCSFSYPVFAQLHSEQNIFSGLFAFVPAHVESVDGRPSQARGLFVSGDFFSTIGAHALVGRTLGPSDDLPGTASALVLGYGYWQRHFGGDRSVLGKSITVNGVPFTVVGITARGFFGLNTGIETDFWVPFCFQPSVSPDFPKKTDAAALWVWMGARLKPGVTASQAESTISEIFARSAASGSNAIFKPDDAPRIDLPSAARGLDTLRQDFSKPLLVLLTAVGIILLIACANVAGLMLARATARRREMGVRFALGAGKSRIIRQLLTESLMLAAAGGALGVVLAYWGAISLTAFLSSNWFMPFDLDVHPEARVLGFTTGVSVLIGILFGLAPAFRSVRADVMPSFKEDSGSTLSSLLGRGWRFGIGNVLVVVQVSLSLVLMAGAGLLVRTLVNLETLDVGFDTHNVLLFDLDPTFSGYKGKQVQSLYGDLQSRLAALPGVTSASYSMTSLLSGANMTTSFRLPNASENMEAAELPVGPNFFETMRIPLLTGRTFAAADYEPDTKPEPVVINRMFAGRLFGKQNPLDRVLAEGNLKTADWRIVGVVGDAKYQAVRHEITPTAYVPLKEGWGAFELRTTADPRGLISLVRNALSSVNGSLSPSHITTQTEQMDRDLYQERLFAWLSSLFGLFALALACIGLYGLLSYEVVRRTREIGIRMALGAPRRNVMRMVVGQGIVLALAGAVVGVIVAFTATRYLATLLYGVKPIDAMTFAGVALLLTAVAWLACYIPARRATKVDPMVALRYE